MKLKNANTEDKGMNLSCYVKNAFTAEATFDFELLHQHVQAAQEELLAAMGLAAGTKDATDFLTEVQKALCLPEMLTKGSISAADMRPQVTEVRPQVLECDVVRFQNNKEKWVALVGLLDGYPYEIFTGLQDDDEGIFLPKSVTKGKIVKQTNPDGTKRYDFQFENKRGYQTTDEGLSEKFNPEYWNYAKLISGVLRYRMPIEHVIKLVSSLQLKSESINTWKNGVERALKKYVTDGTEAKGQVCPQCGHESLVYQEGCLICKNCGASRCG